MGNKNIKILAIDDVQDNLTVLKAIFRDILPNAIVLVATTGAKGINLALSEDPDVILLDIVMSEMDGYEVCRRMKNDPQTKNIPILFLTALKPNSELREKALNAGAEAFLTKPFDETGLITQITIMSKIKEANLREQNEKERLEFLVEERTLEIEKELRERVAIEEELRVSESKYRLLMENSTDVIWVLNLSNNKLTYVSPSVFQLRGYTAEESMKQGIEESLTVKSLAYVRDIITNSVKKFKNDPNADSYLIYEIQQPCKNGDIIWVESSAKLRYNDAGEIEVVGANRNIEERKRQEGKIKFLGYHDSLTGLFNRAFFEEEIKRLGVDRQLPLSVIMGDINGLKLINDSFGHESGDKLIVEIAKILKNCCREEDIISRVGGDEFCILLPKSNEETTQTICNRIYKECSEHEKINKKDMYFVSISLGFTTRTIAHEQIEVIMKDAEEAMYKHKLLETRSLRSSIVSSIISTLHERYIETEEHSNRMKELCHMVGAAMGLSDPDIDDLELLGILHDIGKIAIRDELINKETDLTGEEWEEMKRHTEIGFHITQATIEFQQISEAILSHHERFDGSGYPRQLKGKKIPLLARIISIIDAYDAMTHDRVYRKAITEEAAICELKNNAGTQFDSDIVEIFVKKVLEKG